jgi:hypothetical protein
MPRLPRIPKRVRYPVWSVKTITLLAILVIGLTATSVFVIGKKPLFYETELTLAIVAGVLFLFLAVGLYRGVRVKRWDLPGVDAKGVSMGDLMEHVPDPATFPDHIDAGDFGEGCLVSLVGLLLAILVGVLLLLLLWVLLNLGILLWVFLIAALSYVFYLALRQIFAKSRACKGNLPTSLGYALLYTVLYTGWLFAVVWAAHRIFGGRLEQA